MRYHLILPRYDEHVAAYWNYIRDLERSLCRQRRRPYAVSQPPPQEPDNDNARALDLEDPDDGY